MMAYDVIFNFLSIRNFYGCGLLMGASRKSYGLKIYQIRAQ
jgi:hypothetical protein